MRIAMVWPSLMPTTAVGIRGRSFAEAWARMGAEVAVVTYPQEAGPPIEGVTTVERPLFKHPRDARRLLGSDRALRRLLRGFGPHVVVASSPPAMVLWQASRAARRLRVPFVADVRDLATESLRAVHGRRLRYVLLDRMERKAYARAQALFAVGAIMRDRLAAMGVPQGRIEVVPNGSLPIATRRVPKDVDGLFLGYLHDEGRRPKDLVEALRRIRERRPGARFAFVGWQPSPMSDELARTLREAGVNVELVPPLPRPEAEAWLVRARLGLVSQAPRDVFRTAVGAKTYEYLRAGVPIAALGMEGDSELRRLVEGERVGFFASEPEEFARRFIETLDDPERLAETSVRAAKVGLGFDRSAIAREAYASLERVVTASRSR